MKNCLVAEAAKTSMTVDDLNLFSDCYTAEDWKEREHRRKGGLSVQDQERNMIDLESVGQIMNSSSAFISMRDDYYLVTAVDQFCRQLIDVAFDTSWLWKEEVADHSNIIRHCDAPVDLGAGDSRSKVFVSSAIVLEIVFFRAHDSFLEQHCVDAIGGLTKNSAQYSLTKGGV